MNHERTCPHCGYEHCEADYVDIGVGEQQCGPYVCDRCGAVEIGPSDNVIEADGKRLGRGGIVTDEMPRQLTTEESKTGWYGPRLEWWE